MSVRPLVLSVMTLAVVTAACGGGGDGAAPGAGDVARGQELFSTSCAACHGPTGEGTNAGPSFLNDVYVPSHHDDASFQLAVERGVQPHHWDFGPMPAVPGLDAQDVTDIVAYVRSLQREAGLIE